MADTESKQARFQRGLRRRHNKRIGDINQTPTTENHTAKGAGRTGVEYRYRHRLTHTDVCLTIAGPEKDRNEELFDQLYSRKETIENRFGAPLDWRRKGGPDGPKVCRVVYEVTTEGIENEDRWPELQHELVSAMDRLMNAFEDPLDDLPS